MNIFGAISDFFSLGAPVGPGQPNRREDVIKVETILGNTGHHDLARTGGPLGFWGDRQEKAVKAWQGEHGLVVDGVLKPGGPTITSLRKSAGGLLGGLKPATPDEVDEHHARLDRGEEGLLNIRPARLSLRVPHQGIELDEQTRAFNADTARALGRRSVDGDVPRMYANFFSQAGADGRSTILDLAEQVNEVDGRDRAERVLHGIIGQLSSNQASAFLGGEVPATRALGVRAADLPQDEAPLFVRTLDGDQVGEAGGKNDEEAEGEEVEEDVEDAEEEEADGEECGRLHAEFEQSQEDMITAREDLAAIQAQLDEVDAEIEEIRQMSDDAGALRDQLTIQGAKDFDIGRIPHQLQYLLGPMRTLLKIRGAMEASDHVSHYLISEVYPRRSAAERRRQEIMIQKTKAEIVLKEAAATLSDAANAYQSRCGGEGESNPSKPAGPPIA